MPSGEKDFVIINLKDLNEKFKEGDVVDLATLKEKRLISATGRERKLPLKVLSPSSLILNNIAIRSRSLGKVN